MGYFNVTVKPTVPASKQHTGNFSAQDVLFDWVAFDIPRGGAKLLGATVLVRPKGNTGPTANPFGCFLVFSKTDNTSLGTVNSGAANVPSNDFIGHVEIEDTTSYAAALPSTSVGVSGRASNNSNQHPSLVFARDYDSDVMAHQADGVAANVGYDRFYMGGLAEGEFDFETIIRINDDDIASSSPGTTLVTDGSSMDIQEHFIKGDVLHAHDDAVIGTVASVTNSTTLELTEAIATSVLAADDYVYNIHPIRVILHFEQ